MRNNCSITHQVNHITRTVFFTTTYCSSPPITPFFFCWNSHPFVHHIQTLASANLLSLPLRTKHPTWGKRAFSIAAPTLWNSLPKHIYDCNDTPTFKAQKPPLQNFFSHLSNCPALPVLLCYTLHRLLFLISVWFLVIFCPHIMTYLVLYVLIWFFLTAL